MDQNVKSGKEGQQQEQQPGQPEAGNEIRTLGDLELVLAGGGDGNTGWP